MEMEILSAKKEDVGSLRGRLTLSKKQFEKIKKDIENHEFKYKSTSLFNENEDYDEDDENEKVIILINF
jgi:hypothetical protein